MSMLLMVKAMKTKVGNPTKKLVLIKLADNASDNGECWPSYQHIADHCEIDRRTAMRHINQLEKDGLLRKEYRKGEKGNSSNLYHLSLDGDRVSPGGGVVTLGGGVVTLGGGDHMSPRTSHSIEPVNEPLKPIAPSAAPKVRDEYPLEFKWIWDNKPEREGSNPKRKAFQACNARIKQGATWRQMAEGMRRYRDYCQQSGKINTQYVMTMATFFGPDKHYEQDWKVNHEANSRSSKRGATVDEAMQRLQADIDSITGRAGSQTFDGFEAMAGDGGDLWEGMDQHCGAGAIIDADPVNRVID